VRWIAIASLAAACGEEPRTEDRPDEIDIDMTRRGLIDCTESQDTGYVDGNPFAITVVTVDGKPAQVDTANAYYVMQQAASQDGVDIAVVSGFRTMSQQQYLYDCYVNCNCNNCNLAARPGYSNHQSGHALDLNTSRGGVLNWLNGNGAAFGFERTVPSEDWHWEWWGGGPGGGPCGGCEPSCDGDFIIGQDCGRGDCGAFGARCVDDALGVRCASVFCPDRGPSDLCLDDATIAHCEDGAITTGDCSAYGALCSTALGEARCISALCVGSGSETPVAHDICLEGGRYHCDERGGIAEAPCAKGELCMQELGAVCVRPEVSLPDVEALPIMTAPQLDPERTILEAEPLAPADDTPVHGGCGCSAGPREGRAGAVLFALLLGVTRLRARGTLRARCAGRSQGS
jgi:hypothetical protein